ncbi:MAG TPA: Plug domain-containing protein, partial [Nitrospiraceae bacterium]|nr:Plug domain-containing protein [Nitrospiraceae bacterium]
MRYVGRAWSRLWIMGLLSLGIAGIGESWAQTPAPEFPPPSRMVKGWVQYEDLRKVGQVAVHVRDQEGQIVSQSVTNEAGEFSVAVPTDGAYSVSALQGTLRSEYVILRGDVHPVESLTLTLVPPVELALEVVAPLPPLQYKATSETYSLTRKEIEALPRGNNIDLPDLLATIPSAAQGALKQVHIRQDHANVLFRIDGVPIPDTVSTTFTDVLTPRAWERADIILGGLEAQYGNRSAAVIDITGKSGTKPGFGS